jgi:hypothetical protein
MQFKQLTRRIFRRAAPVVAPVVLDIPPDTPDASLTAAIARTVGKHAALGQGYGNLPAGQSQSPVAAANQTKKQSNLRFRSFAERYLVTRSAFFRKDAAGLQEDMWSCILDAKTIYKTIGEVGLNVDD